MKRPVFLVVVCSVLGAVAQLFYKLGVERIQLSLVGLLTNYYLILGVLLYLTSAAVLVAGLKHGKLSVLYPFISLSYIWVALLSMRFLGEAINAQKWAGILIIIIGVSLIGVGEK